jgi:predicted nucleic-acid-binding protein
VKGIDSNVLVRLLTGDDPVQVARARTYVEANAPCWVNRVVTCEAVWVLDRVYRLSPARLALALKQLMQTIEFEFEDFEAIEAGIAALEGGGDFADTVIVVTNVAQGCEATGTFDRKASRLGGFEAL